ncbi:AAA-like domain protein [Planctomycetes bacterium CA13]|uniref:AAA-like domain protein n=1 Tax=Novipirellula herctigrandis TaxID=2527986 RepID=A0A5C5ZE28_9BACT|nr:AAA-like domain protein [Planctomycetes bacterium CA13]
MLTSTAGNERGIRYSEQVFANLGRYPFTLLVLPVDGSATLAVQCKAKHHHAIGRELQAAYPDLRISKTDDAILKPINRRRSKSLTLWPCYFSLRPYGAFWNEADRSVTDPIASLLAAIAPDGNPVRAMIALQCKPLSFLRRKLFARRCEKKGDPEKPNHQVYRCRLRVSVDAPRRESRLAKERLSEVRAVFGQYESGTPASFYAIPFYPFMFALNDVELATIWHPSTVNVKATKMKTNDSRELEAPLHIGSEKEAGTAVLGTLAFRGDRQPFGIKRDDRRRHLAIIGKTGMGKSTLLQQLIVSDMAAGRGVGLIDPHGDLADEVLKFVPKHRTGDVLLLDAGERAFPPACNPLHCGQGTDTSLTASGVVSAFKKLYGDSWGPRLEHILRNSVLALVEVKGTSLISLMRMLSDEKFRESIVNQVDDPLVRAFWLDEFANKPAKWKEEAVAPIQNKVGQFLASPLLRSIVGQVPGRIDLRQAMDRERIVIVNLSKGRIGEDACTLLGALLVTGLQQAAMSRSDVPEAQRKDFYMYVDEFQNFATDSFGTILSEARKYRLNLILANQFLDQMEEGTRQAVFGNVGSMLCFQVGTTDAEVLAPQLAGDVTPPDLVALPKYQAYARLLVDGMPSKPFSMQTMPPAKLRGADRSEIIRRTSRRQYSRPIDSVLRVAAGELRIR